ncbi:MAG: phosphate ABC transporter substrate-binding protein PstS [Gemmatimonadaceae bacterium]
MVFGWLGLLAGFAIGIEWIRSRPAGPPPPSGGIDLVGAGATLPYPLYRRWFSEYGAAEGVRINYFSVGTGEGLRLLLADSVDFGAIDRPLRAEERRATSCGPLEVPTVVGAIVVAYNLPGIAAPLALDEATLAAIFLGRITRWDAAEIRALNPGVSLGPVPIRVIRRAPSSGTNEVFARYLDVDATWAASRASRATVGIGDVVEGNEGVASQVRVSAGAIGFLELTYAQQNKLQLARLRNRAGRFVTPDSGALARTASELLSAPGGDTLLALVGARDTAAYPVAALTRIVAAGALADPRRGGHLVAFVRWALRDGATAAEALGYAPLPETVVRRQLDRLDGLRPGTCPSTPPR